MKKSLGSFIALNRRSLLLLGVVLSITVFGFVTWQAGAQNNKRTRENVDGKEGKLDLSAYPESKRNRILADDAANDGSDVATEPPAAIEAPDGALPSCATEVIYAYKIFAPDDHLIRFNPATPGTIAPADDFAVTGFNSVDEYLESIDFRPANGQLYGIATDKITSRVVTVNTTTGVITSVGGTFPAPGTPPGNGLFGFFGGDFNPVVDRIRETSDINSNRRLNPNDGSLAGTDTPLAYAPGDPHFGAVPAVVNIAYLNNTAGAASTTLYGIDSTQNTLVTIGSPGGSPVSPNSGQVFTIGALGVNPTNFGGFDIQQGTNVAYAALRVSSSSQLYKINLTTGAATLVGTIGTGSDPIDGLTVAMGPSAACSDLSITKTDGAATYTPGAATTYTITANNFGPDPVVGATVTDNFPGQITSANWTCAGSGGGVCPANGSGNINASVDLPVGGSVTFTVTANTSPGAAGNLVNSASIATPTGVTDATAGNNTATDTDTATPQADLSITKTDGVTTVSSGGTTTYTIVASNPTGPSNVIGGGVLDNFPATITSVNWTCVGSGGGTCGASSGSGNISDLVNLPVGGKVTYTAVANISPSATGSMSNTASVLTLTSGVTDPNPANNSATDTDTVVALADLSITKTDGVTTVTAGGTTTYTIVASNPTGPSNVIGGGVLDTFPATITSVNWTCVGSGGGTCSASGSGNISDLVNLPVGGKVTYTAVANISPSATFGMSNTATVLTLTSGVTDPNPANNTARDVDNICSGTTFSYSGAPVPIPDAADLSGTAPGAPANATLNVAGVPGPIADINFSIDGTACSATAGSTTVGLDHTFVNDLKITLISPNNTQVLVINNTDGSGNNFCQVILDDQTANPNIQTALTAQAPFTGTWKPNAPLSAFNGQNANGTWTLRAQDFFSGDTGNIRAFSLNITACPTTAAGVSVSGRVMTPDGRGLRNARVVITDSQGNARTVTTSSFGTYQFDDVAVGDNYVIGVVSKQYRFASQLIQVGDTLTDINFDAQE